MNYLDNFDATRNNTAESLFEVQYSGNTEYNFWGNDVQSSWLSTFMGPRNSDFVAGSYGWNQPTEEFVSQYEEGDLFISEGNGKLYISKGSSYGKGYRSYIDYTGTETSSASTKTLSLTFSGVEDGEDDGTTTEISVAELADDVIEAFGIKGVYNLNGQKVAETTRNLPAGIYVVNGRKVVVK